MAHEQQNNVIRLEDVWGKMGCANIISGIISRPLCFSFLSVCCQERKSAQNLNQILQAMAGRQMLKEILLLLEIICDIADEDYPAELAEAIQNPEESADLIRELVLDFDEILTEETA